MILSASRRTDIPNYYSEWFINRIREGFLYVRNPMNAQQVSKINLSPDVIDCIVFWTKNPINMLGKLEELKPYMYYFQFTLTGYGRDVEPNAYSCAMKSHFRKFGNQMSGSGNHLCEFTRAVFYLDHTPPAWTCHAQHQYL